MRMPSHGRTTRPLPISSALTAWAIFDGMANPRPRFRPLISVFTPMTLPSKSTSGPPLLPGLMEASVCR